MITATELRFSSSGTGLIYTALLGSYCADGRTPVNAVKTLRKRIAAERKELTARNADHLQAYVSEHLPALLAACDEFLADPKKYIIRL